MFELLKIKTHPQNVFFFFVTFTNLSQKVYNFHGSYSDTRFLYKQLQLLRVKARKWPEIKQLLSTAQAKIDPKKLKLKLTAQQATLLVVEY